MKRHVYQNGRPRSKAELVERLYHAANQITVQDVASANRNFLDRLALVQAEDGHHIEHVM